MCTIWGKWVVYKVVVHSPLIHKNYDNITTESHIYGGLVIRYTFSVGLNLIAKRKRKRVSEWAEIGVGSAWLKKTNE